MRYRSSFQMRVSYTVCKKETNDVREICVCLRAPGVQSCSVAKSVKHHLAGELCPKRMHMQKPCQHAVKRKQQAASLFFVHIKQWLNTQQKKMLTKVKCCTLFVLSCAKHVEFVSESRHPFFILLFAQVPERANVLAQWMCS